MKRIIFLLSLIAFIASANNACAQKAKDRGPLLYFNYELHDGGDEVLSLRKYNSDGAVYFRFFGDLDGYTYYRVSDKWIKEIENCLDDGNYYYYIILQGNKFKRYDVACGFVNYWPLFDCITKELYPFRNQE